jgi:hypothetical protein
VKVVLTIPSKWDGSDTYDFDADDALKRDRRAESWSTFCKSRNFSHEAEGYVTSSQSRLQSALKTPRDEEGKKKWGSFITHQR